MNLHNVRIKAYAQVGMTGTRDGITDDQRMVAYDFLLMNQRRVVQDLGKGCDLHHGDCIGADAQVTVMCQHLGYGLSCHPPKNKRMRAYIEADRMYLEKGYLTRNRDIVNDSEILFGFPRTMHPDKGGTWYAINYATKVDKPVVIIYPDGSIELRNHK